MFYSEAAGEDKETIMRFAMHYFFDAVMVVLQVVLPPFNKKIVIVNKLYIILSSYKLFVLLVRTS